MERSGEAQKNEKSEVVSKDQSREKSQSTQEVKKDADSPIKVDTSEQVRIHKLKDRHKLSLVIQKHPGGGVVSFTGFGLQHPGFESGRNRNSAHDSIAPHYIESFIITLMLYQYDLNNVERDVTHQLLKGM